MGLFAIWYSHSAEGREIVAAWEQRALLAGVGVLAAYVLLRLRSSPGQSGRARSGWRIALRLIAGGVTAAGLWLGVDLLRGDSFLFQLWEALPPQNENVVRALVLVGCGWAAWSVGFSELFRRFAVGHQQSRAAPTVAPDGAGLYGNEGAQLTPGPPRR
jgi:hypothetical protein